MKLPMVIATIKGAYNEKYLNLESKYKYQVLDLSNIASSENRIKAIQNAFKKYNVVIVDAIDTYINEIYEEGLSFVQIYPEDNSCGIWQDRMDDLNLPEKDIENVVASWKKVVADHTLRQLADDVVVINDDQYIDD